MAETQEQLLGVPTNVITGFLGVGKTSAILHLLAQKPADERWAVLVNEFGEIGVDGSLVQGQADDGQIHITEVPGGCMCCTAGLPMQIALAQLLRKARPRRLLIEPTGLGHPVEVLQALSTDSYRDVLTLNKTLTLLDARNLSDNRYTSHPTFVQQLEIADIIMANKEDLYSTMDRQALDAYLKRHCADNVELLVTRFGEIDLNRLNGPSSTSFEPRHAHTHGTEPELASDLPLPERGYITAVNGGEGFESIGWRFSPTKVFDREKLLAFLKGLRVERMKAVFITHDGIFGYNLTRDALQELAIDECPESRIEVIAERIEGDWEQQLTACLQA